MDFSHATEGLKIRTPLKHFSIFQLSPGRQFPQAENMGSSLQPSISIAEVLPQNVNNNTPESAGASPTRPGFTRSQSTLVGQYIDEKTPKGSIEVGSPVESCQESKPQGDTLETGKLASWKGALILLVTGGAMFMDNVFMTSTNISLAAIQEEFGVQSSDLQWMISAYTLSFGGFLLLSGVMSDRFEQPFTPRAYEYDR
jgi:hypothetical protein